MYYSTAVKKQNISRSRLMDRTAVTRQLNTNVMGWFLFLIAAFAGCGPSPNGSGGSLPLQKQSAANEPNALDRKSLEDIAGQVIQTLVESQSKDGRPFALPKDQGPVYVALREGGIKRASAWHTGADWHQGTIAAVQQAQSRLRQARSGAIDTIELCLTHSYRTIDLVKDRRHITNIHRGVRGLELVYGTTHTVWSPTELIARNISFDNALQRFADANGLTQEQLNSPKVRKRVLEAYQFLVALRGKPVVRPMFRGNILVPIEEVTQENVRLLAKGLGDWLVDQVHPDGRITYKYWPSRGEESSSNNMIRQFMASICLGRLAAFRNDSALVDLSNKNLVYNFDKFYRREGELGLIEYQDKVKLGAVALAALAIVESPVRENYTPIEESLRNLVDHLWNPNGSFRTFYKPAGRNDNQNFYPGEALLFWAKLYDKKKDPELRKKILTSFHYYRRWHLDARNRNPAFVPWHTQAYYILWQESRSEALRDFIFTMNDWLLAMQQWETTQYDDTKGRFYDPARPQYGPPHASSTGVYLEGLIDAFCLAKEMGDEKRVVAYRRAIVRGLRSVMQLQFADDIDMYYISKRARVKGALRTTVYHNEIRVDNVQHNLMAIMKILEHFEPTDYVKGQAPPD